MVSSIWAHIKSILFPRYGKRDMGDIKRYGRYVSHYVRVLYLWLINPDNILKKYKKVHGQIFPLHISKLLLKLPMVWFSPQ